MLIDIHVVMYLYWYERITEIIITLAQILFESCIIYNLVLRRTKMLGL